MMKSIRLTEVCAVLILLSTVWSVAGESPAARRKPLVRPPDEEAKFKPTGMGVRLDPTTHQPVQYAIEGKIALDRGAGNYALEWNGVDGQRKKLIWVPPNKVAAEVTGLVSYDPKLHLFEYTYQVTSLPESEQKLQSLYIASRSEILSGNNPDQTWYSTSFTPYLKQVFRSEGGWTWSRTMGGKIGLEPREAAKGFRFRSLGVPAVVNCYVRGHTDTLHSSEDLPEELMEAIDLMAWKIPYGVTIGPGLPADRLSAQQIAQNLSRSLEVGSKQGWILEGSDASSIKRIIEELGLAVSSRNNADVVRLSEDAIHLVDAAYGRGVLLSEAQGLLTYNLSALKESVSKAGIATPSQR